jgi:hypothetical protein
MASENTVVKSWRCGCSNVAAISSEAAAALYGLHVLEHNIQDNKEGDITRFVLLSRSAPRTALTPGVLNERSHRLSRSHKWPVHIKDLLLMPEPREGAPEGNPGRQQEEIPAFEEYLLQGFWTSVPRVNVGLEIGVMQAPHFSIGLT